MKFSVIELVAFQRLRGLCEGSYAYASPDDPRDDVRVLLDALAGRETPTRQAILDGLTDEVLERALHARRREQDRSYENDDAALRALVATGAGYRQRAALQAMRKVLADAVEKALAGRETLHQPSVAPPTEPSTCGHGASEKLTLKLGGQDVYQCFDCGQMFVLSGPRDEDR
jgi:hypothetical protein